MSTGNVKVASEVYISHPISAIWQAFLRWRDTNLAVTIGVMALVFVATMVGVIIIFAIIAANMAGSGTLSDDPNLFFGQLIQYGWFTILFGVIGLILLLLPFTIAVDYSFVSSQNNRKVSVGQALRRGYQRLFIGLGTYALAFLIITGGLVLLIVPGIYFALRLSYLNSIVANENSGVMDNIRRSWRLTHGNVWDILGVGSVATIVGTALSIIMTAVVGVAESTSNAGIGAGLTAIMALLMVALSLVTAPGLYFRYHQSALEKDKKLKKQGTDRLNYIAFAVAILMTALGTYTDQTVPSAPYQPGDGYTPDYLPVEST